MVDQVPCQDLLQAVVELCPTDTRQQQLRYAFLLSMHDPQVSREDIKQRLGELQMQLRIATDQHAAVTTELDELASTNPCEFSPDHLWTLVRAIRVQNGILNFYLGEESLEAQPLT